MSDVPLDPSARPEHPARADETNTPQPGASGRWLPRWPRAGADLPEPAVDAPDAPVAAVPPQERQAPLGQPGPNILKNAGSDTHLYGDVEVVAGVIEELILQTRKREVLEGSEISRSRLLEQPFVRGRHWESVREEAVDPATGRLRQPVLIIVAPRSWGSTTLALRLLAEHTDDRTTVVKLDVDWNAPARAVCLWRKRTPSSSTSSTVSTTSSRPSSWTGCQLTPPTSATAVPIWC
ncbi:hypothetical protein [Streptomyces sp. CA-132043]|uniref:hypothetical protein n=1 Tax=Streptomyces sp. CA-132043 TaxID=3240048 RepID=UPI003D8FA441